MTPFTLNLRGRLAEYSRPVVMGVLNVTPDSFYSGSRAQTHADITRRARQLVADGADMLDIGAYSSRPGADDVSADEELRRLEAGLSAVREAVGYDIPVSVDTFRADVARRAVEWGADIINDISGGLLDEGMFETVADLHVPYILMHMRGTPATMQTMTDYTDVVADVIGELSHKLSRLEELGVADVIIDPGFGFAKTLDQNYRLLSQLDAFAILGRPVLAGMSRKSMLTRLLGIDATEALVPTAIVGALALERGAAILRVHDPREAAQAIAIVEKLKIKG
ncbi:MAG: dihydropteroate synthase [Muribaculaceae bacterium]